MKIKNVRSVSFLVCCMLILSSSLCFAQGSKSEDFSSTNIIGGVKIVDGIRYEMSQEEAQSEYLEENSGMEIQSEYLEKNSTMEAQSEDLKENSGVIQPRVVVQTKISSATAFNGANERISVILHNDTSSLMTKQLTGSKTYSASATGGVALSDVVKGVNANFSLTVATSETKSDTTTVTIKPGEKFYITFTPRLVKVKGKQLVSMSHGQSAWKSFEGTFPKVVSGAMDGNIYYVTK